MLEAPLTEKVPIVSAHKLLGPEGVLGTETDSPLKVTVLQFDHPDTTLVCALHLARALTHFVPEDAQRYDCDEGPQFD